MAIKEMDYEDSVTTIERRQADIGHGNNTPKVRVSIFPMLRLDDLISRPMSSPTASPPANEPKFPIPHKTQPTAQSWRGPQPRTAGYLRCSEPHFVPLHLISSPPPSSPHPVILTPEPRNEAPEGIPQKERSGYRVSPIGEGEYLTHATMSALAQKGGGKPISRRA